MDTIRPFMGNPFYAPGTMGFKSVIMQNNKKGRISTNSTISTDKISEESNFIADGEMHKLNKEIQMEI